MLDFLLINDLFDDGEKQIQKMARDFVNSKVLKHVGQWWEDGIVPSDLIEEFGRLGFFGANLQSDYGTAGISNVAYGLMMYELERADSGLRSLASVQGSLVMYPILTYGSLEQQRKYLGPMASGEVIGCFGLTEHEGGSDPGGMKTTARRDGDFYVLNGTKMWISNGSIAQIAIIWAKDQDGTIRGFLVPTDSIGFSTRAIKHKMSLRLSVTSELIMDDVKVHASQMLPNAIGLRAPLSCLNQARYGICWGALGALELVYEEALNFAQNRVTFGNPISARQLVQSKLTDMLSDHSKGLLLAWRLGNLKDAGSLNHVQVSMAKRDNVRAALKGARNAREILGASGITLDNHSIRHMLNLETVDTYEGTYDIHTLVVGKYITGKNAFS